MQTLTTRASLALDRLRAATGDALTIAFTPAVLAAIGTELEKVHAARQLARQRTYPPEIRTHLDSEAYRRPASMVKVP